MQSFIQLNSHGCFHLIPWPTFRGPSEVRGKVKNDPNHPILAGIKTKPSPSRDLGLLELRYSEKAENF